MGYESEVLSDGPVVWVPNGKRAEDRAMTLTGFLLARISEDEAAFAVDPDDPTADEWREAGDLNEAWIASVSTRMLAECEAKRRIVYYVTADADGPEPLIRGRARTALLQHLALPYSDHPDYRDEWRPEGSGGEPWYTKHLPADDAEAAAQAEARKRGGRD